jgi:hypothetical protein
MIRLLTVTLPGNGGTEYIYPEAIESMRETSPVRHAPDSKTVVRTQSGREIAVADDYEELVKQWENLL